MTDKEKLDKINELVEIGLMYNISEFELLLEDIQRVINGLNISTNIEDLEHYFD